MFTCEQLREMMLKSPTDCTAAERGAFARHYNTCEDCRRFLEEKHEAAMSKLSPVGRVITTIAADITGAMLITKDSQDPEAW